MKWKGLLILLPSLVFLFPPPSLLPPPSLGCRHIYIKPLKFKYMKLHFTMRKSNIKKPPNNAKKNLKNLYYEILYVLCIPHLVLY